MRILAFLGILIILYLSDCYLSDKSEPKACKSSSQTIIPPSKPMETHFDRVEFLKPKNKDTVIVWEYPKTRYPILEGN